MSRQLSAEELALHRHVPMIDRRRARIHSVRLLPGGSSAMTFGRHILVRRGFVYNQRLLAHEPVHVWQWRHLGTARFLWRYLVPYLRERLRGAGHWEAYELIPLEAEARHLSAPGFQDVARGPSTRASPRRRVKPV